MECFKTTASKIAFQSYRLTIDELDDIIAEERLNAYLNKQNPHKWLCDFWKEIYILRSKNK